MRRKKDEKRKLNAGQPRPLNQLSVQLFLFLLIFVSAAEKNYRHPLLSLLDEKRKNRFPFLRPFSRRKDENGKGGKGGEREKAAALELLESCSYSFTFCLRKYMQKPLPFPS